MEPRRTEDKFARARERMVKYDLAGRGITNLAVLEVMGQIPREEFVLDQYKSQAYADGPLPIGCGQTISQPYIVALMTQELRLNRDCEVLEIGTGCGYQTAILSELAKKVYTIEKWPQLSESAQAVLGRVGINNVEFFIGDGSCGRPDGGQFERIMFTAAAPDVPKPFFEQLKPGGIIVGPVGLYGVQRLIVCEKKGEQLSERTICEVRFVKLLGEFGFKE